MATAKLTGAPALKQPQAKQVRMGRGYMHARGGLLVIVLLAALAGNDRVQPRDNPARGGHG